MKTAITFIFLDKILVSYFKDCETGVGKRKFRGNRASLSYWYQRCTKSKILNPTLNPNPKNANPNPTPTPNKSKNYNPNPDPDPEN